MNKRTKFYLRNIQLFSKKYIFNSKYIIRNMLIATIIMTLVATGTGLGTVVTHMPKKEKAEKTEAVVTENVTENVTEEFAINLEAVPMLDDNLISNMRASLEADILADIEPNDTEMVSSANNGFDSKFVAIEDNVNIRTEATTDSEVVGKINDGVVGDVVSVDGDWVEISSGAVSGYVKSEFIITGDEAYEYAEDYKTVLATVNDDSVNVRSKASKEADVIETAYEGTKYVVVEETDVDNDWVCVEVVDGKGYINSDFVEVRVTYPEASALEEKDSLDDTDDSTDEEEEPETPNEPEEPQEPEEPEKPEDPGKPSVITRDSISLTEEEILLMSVVVTLESGGECYEGQLAVANVIINRLVAGSWGSSVSDVIYAPGQFSCVGTDRFYTLMASGAQASCVQAVREAAAGTNNIGSYMSFRPTSYIDVSTLGSYAIIGNHVFF